MQNYTQQNPSLVPLKYPYCIGSMIWTGYDYLGESMGYPSKGWSGAMLRTNGVKRPSYYMLQSYWSKEPMVHFAVVDYSLQDEMVKEHWDTPPFADHWHFPQFYKALIPYMIASNCDEVALYVNDKRYYLPSPKACPNSIITGYLPYQSGIVRVEGYNKGEKVCTHRLETPDVAIKLQFEQSIYEVKAECGYEMLLTVQAVDYENRPCFRESSQIRFYIEGAAEIIGVDNGNLMSHEPYHHQAIHMYHGVASVMIRLSTVEGRVVVGATAEGMFEARAVIVLSH